MAEWLSSLTFDDQQNNTFSKCAPGTMKWFLESQKFKEWLNGKRRTLWCPGKREICSIMMSLKLML
jgi:hypothetical protein